MSNLARLALLPLICGLAACGGKASATDDNSGGANTRGGSSNGGGGHIAGAGTGGASVDPVCTKYDDEPRGALPISILNKTDAPIYLGQAMVTCSTAPLFEVADARGGKLPSVGDCRASCVGLRTQGQGGCVTSCALPTSIVLQPGELGITGWDGLYLVPGSLPAECVQGQPEAENVNCDMAKRVVPGTYKFSARAGTSVDCSQTSASGSCPACTLHDVGGCAIPGSLISGKILTASATVELDQSYGVYGSSADAPAPGGNGDVPAYQTIELVFTNP